MSEQIRWFTDFAAIHCRECQHRPMTVPASNPTQGEEG